MINTHKTLNIKTIDEYVLQIELNRPEAANALNTDMANDLKTVLEACKNQEYRAMILCGAGKHFCAGADLKERKGMTQSQWEQQHHALEHAQQAIMHCPIPIIAAVHGAAFGGGLEIALSCDFIYASKTARFGLTETTLGIIPGMGGTQLLARRIGSNLAREHIYLGKPFTASEAYEWRMVNRLCEAEDVRDHATACANRIAQNAPLAIKAAKTAISEGLDLPLHEGLAIELTQYNSLLNTKDRYEGIDAFNEKRAANFTGK